MCRKSCKITNIYIQIKCCSAIPEVYDGVNGFGVEYVDHVVLRQLLLLLSHLQHRGSLSSLQLDILPHSHQFFFSFSSLKY